MLLACALAAPAGAQQTRLSAPEAGVSAFFPGKPTAERTEVAAPGARTLPVQAYYVARAGREWIVMYVEHAALDAGPGDAERIEAAVRSFVGNKRLVSRRALHVAGLPAEELVVATGSGMIGRGRLLLAGRWLVQIVYTGPEGTESEPRVLRFLDSLRIAR
ncbi:MAG: hypothetical protein ACREUO_03215 [Burkholderiales bacterium]